MFGYLSSLRRLALGGHSDFSAAIKLNFLACSTEISSDLSRVNYLASKRTVRCCSSYNESRQKTFASGRARFKVRHLL
jgi:hypothetical protein